MCRKHYKRQTTSRQEDARKCWSLSKQLVCDFSPQIAMICKENRLAAMSILVPREFHVIVGFVVEVSFKLLWKGCRGCDFRGTAAAGF